jgi:hypothetical protein
MLGELLVMIGFHIGGNKGAPIETTNGDTILPGTSNSEILAAVILKLKSRSGNQHS